MSNLVKGITLGLILILIGGLAFIAIDYQGRLNSMSERLDQNEQEINSLQQEKEALKERVGKLETQNSELVNQIETAQEKIKTQREEIDGLTEENNTLTKKLKNLQDEIETINVSLEKSTKDLNERITTVNQTLKSDIAEVKENSATKNNLKNLETVVTEQGNQVENLETKVENLSSGNVSASPSGIKIGYVNATEAFTVFTDAVKEERQSAQAKDEELISLREKAIQGEISESEYRQQADILQAEKLKAQLEIDMAMVEKMRSAPGFESVVGQLEDLSSQVQPIVEELNTTLENMRRGTASPEAVSNTLSQINSQYQQLDDLLTRLIESKIFQIANVRANESGYDLVLRQENVVLYGNQNSVDNLTDMAKSALREEIG